MAFSAAADTFKFAKIGDQIAGTITAVEEDVPGTDLQGKAVTNDILSIETASGESYRVFMKPNMKYNLGVSLREAGVKKPEIGGKVAIAYTEDKPSETKGFSPQKIFSVQYKKAVVQSSILDEL